MVILALVGILSPGMSSTLLLFLLLLATSTDFNIFIDCDFNWIIENIPTHYLITLGEGGRSFPDKNNLGKISHHYLNKITGFLATWFGMRSVQHTVNDH